MTQLIVEDGTLYYPDGSILVTRLEGGDPATIRWPLKDEQRTILACCLYDDFECGVFEGRKVLLPDGTEFDFDDVLAENALAMIPTKDT